MNAENQNNCLGFVYHALGIDPEEQFRRTNGRHIVLDPYFEQVEQRDEADIVAAINKVPDEFLDIGREGYFVPHVAVIIKGTGRVRERKGHDEPIREVDEDIAFERYDRNSTRVYLRLRQTFK